jgi:peptide/nickel transport system substrate-binding protein
LPFIFQRSGLISCFIFLLLQRLLILFLQMTKTPLILVLFISLFSCTKHKSNFADKQVFRYNEPRNITSLDPAYASNQANIWAVNQLFNGLVQLDDALHIKPDLATKWTISTDGLDYEFIIRKHVFFHKNTCFKDSTRAVTAYDFEYSFKRLQDKNLALPGSWTLAKVSHLKAINDTVFQIKLQEPFPAFLGLLTMKYCSVVPQEAIEKYSSDFRRNPVGTGAFQFKLWVENTKLVLRKNPLYFERDAKGNTLPYLEAIAIKFLPDRQSGFMEFIQGKSDFISGLDPSYKDDILNSNGSLQAKYQNRITLIKGAYLNTEYLGFYFDAQANKAMQSRYIRQAINYGFDREKMIRFLRNGIGIPAINGIVPKGMPSFANTKGFDYQPEKAKALIDKYKQESGDTNPKVILSTNSSYLDLCEYIQGELSKLGLEIQIDVNPPATLRQEIAQGKKEFFRASWIADYPDAQNYLSLFYSKNFKPKGPNATHYASKEFDLLYEQSFTIVADALRFKSYQKMDSLLMAEAPIVPLYYDEVLRFQQKNIKGMTVNPINLLQLKTVWKE